MKASTQHSLAKHAATEKEDLGGRGTCATGRCCAPGLCPGVAIFLAYLAGGVIASLTGLTWVGWAVGIPTALVLLTGAWGWLPRHKPS